VSFGTEQVRTGEITRLIGQWQLGDRDAESALFSALYDALYGIALRVMRNEPRGQSLGPTALVHEAYLRFSKAEGLQLNNRAHFLALSAQVMRRILVDRARARRAAKREGIRLGAEAIDLVPTDRDADQIIAVDRAMNILAQSYPDECRLVELRWFAGYSVEQCAEILSLSSRTVRRRWNMARIRLKELIDGTGPLVD
jgi:RNA polymerase sigma factor (TIGR02999 family)